MEKLHKILHAFEIHRHLGDKISRYESRVNVWTIWWWNFLFSSLTCTYLCLNNTKNIRGRDVTPVHPYHSPMSEMFGHAHWSADTSMRRDWFVDLWYRLMAARRRLFRGPRCSEQATIAYSKLTTGDTYVIPPRLCWWPRLNIDWENIYIGSVLRNTIRYLLISFFVRSITLL